MKIIVSACLLGYNVKYDGKNNLNEDLIEFLKDYEVISICPEVMGGLSIPRDPSEIKGDLVISNKGNDVTSNYLSGAYQALQLVGISNITKAVLKDGSPSCGSTYIYDGTFTKNIINGMGITAELLKENNIIIYNENEIEKLL